MQSIDRAVAILETFTSEQPILGVAEIARLTGLTRSTTHRILASLARHELVIKVNERGRYALGPHVIRLASVLNASRDLLYLAKPIMTRLRDETGETVGFHVLHSDSRVIVDQVESLEPLRRTYTEIGEPLPLHQGAPGKVLLAFAPDQLRQQVLRGALEAATEHTIVDSKKLEKDLAETIKRSYALSYSERVRGIHTIAVPVFIQTGEVVATLSITGPSSRLSRRRLVEIAPAAIAAGRELSQLLGFRSKEVGS